MILDILSQLDLLFLCISVFFKEQNFWPEFGADTRIRKTKLHAMTSKGLPNSRQRLAFAHSIISNLKAKFTR